MTPPFPPIFPADASRTPPRPAYPTIGPRTVPFRPQDEAEYPENPFMQMLREAYGFAKQNAPMGIGYGMEMAEGLGHDVGALKDAIANRNVPGAGGREGIFNAALPLLGYAYPMGAAPSVGAKAEMEIAEQALKQGLPFEGIFRQPGDAELIAHLRAQRPDVSHFSTEELRQQIGMTGKRLGAFTDNPVSAAQSEVAIAHDQAYMRALTDEFALRRQREARPAPRDVMEDPYMLGSHQHESAGALPGGPDIPAPTGGRTLIKGGLSKEEAVALNKEQAKAGKATTMQRNPDGTFEVWEKGAGAKGPREDIGVEKPKEAPKKTDAELKAEALGVTPEEIDFVQGARAKLDELSNRYGEVSNGGHGYTNRAERQAELQRISDEYTAVQQRRDQLEQQTSFLTRNPKATVAEVQEYGALVKKRRRMDEVIREQQELINDGVTRETATPEQKAIWDEAETYDYEARRKVVDDINMFSENIAQRAANRAKEQAGLTHEAAYDDFRRAQERGVPADRFPHDEMAPDISVQQGDQQVSVRKPFMSRAYNVIRRDYADAGALRPDEWLEKLSKDGRFSPQEVDFLKEMTKGGKDSHFSESLILPEEMAELVKRRGPVGKLDLQYSERRQLADPTGTIPLNKRETPLEPKNISEFLPEAKENYFGSAPMREKMTQVYEELSERFDDSMREAMTRSKIDDVLKERQEAIDSFIENVDQVMGKSVGGRFLKYLKEHPLEIKDADGEVVQTVDFIPNKRAFEDESTRQAWVDNYDDMMHHISERMNEFFGEDPTYNGAPEQLSFPGEERYDAERRMWVTDQIRPELEGDARYYARRNMQRQNRETGNLADLHRQINEGDYSDYDLKDRLYNDIFSNPEGYFPPPSEEDIIDIARAAQAKELERRTNQPLPLHDKTQFQNYQRVNKNMPYEELTIYTPGSGVQGGHFNNATDLASHARTEFHTDPDGSKTQLLLESQSDYAKNMTDRRRREMAAKRPVEDTKTPWESGGTYNKPNVAAAMYRGALKGMEWFSWSSPLNRNRRAHLHADPATRGYGREIPEHVRKVFEHLGEPIEVERWRPQGTTDEGGYANPEGFLPSDQDFIRVRITPKMREKIIKGGIPALGLGAFVLGNEKGKGAQ